MKMEFIFDDENNCYTGPDHLNPDNVSLEEFAASIQRGHDDIAAGRYYSLDEAFAELMKKYSTDHS